MRRDIMAKFLPLVFVYLYFLTGVRYHAEAGDGEKVECRGRYTREAQPEGSYEIVVPRKVKSDGKFVSHQIPHHYKRSLYKGRRRVDMTPDDALHYRVRIDGEEHHLELYPNHRLLSPGAVVERRVLDPGEPATDEGFLDSAKLRRLRDTECHYHGAVRDHHENSALSACYGLAGYIRTKRSWYMIEPLADHDFTKDVEHPHIVYKRSPDEFQSKADALCNVTDNLARNIAKRAANHKPGKNEPKSEVKSYTVELLAVLDKPMLDYHKDFDVENYILTLFNMAGGLFHDVSLGVEMELAIVRIIRLEVEEDGMNLSVNKDADATLKYFQEWQKKMNPGDDSHPNHHDCAILLTKTEICMSQTLCAFTGMTTIAGTCDPLKGAAVVKDNGLETGYHIAHHIGHTIGMSHDVEEENGCSGIIIHPNGYIETTVMHPGNFYITKRWSKCSQSYVKLYLEAGLATCLLDEAQDHQFPLIEMLPGVMYTGDDQCRLRYRQDVRQCDIGITCETLKCAVPGKGCISGKRPPAEGTACGEKRWCYQMRCLMIGERPGAVDAGWGPWSAWSRCSRTCGSGVSSSIRKCNHPQASKGGDYCRGNAKRHKICATDPCEIGAPSFRDVQCAEFNDWIFPEDGKVHQWVGYNLPENLKASENPCVLFCLSETKLLTSLKPKVVDGTTCYRGIRDICIGGICKEIPCDLDMESQAVEDVCGVCKGDSTSCLLKEGTLVLGEQTRLKKILDVPAGAKNVRVEEAQPTKSRIVVRSKNAKNVLIDGTRLGMFDVPGSKAWLGMIRAKQEALNIPGPITEDLVILVFPKENVTLKFSLGLKQDVPRKGEFDWDFIEWSRCNAPCGPGEQVAKPRCVEKIGGQVDEIYCRNISKPEIRVRPCNQAPCVPRWMIGDWQGCVPCSPGCRKTRAVKCIRPVGHGEQEADIISDVYCQGPKPKESENCNFRGRRDSSWWGYWEDNEAGIEDDALTDGSTIGRGLQSRTNQRNTGGFHDHVENEMKDIGFAKCEDAENTSYDENTFDEVDKIGSKMPRRSTSEDGQRSKRNQKHTNALAKKNTDECTERPIEVHKIKKGQVVIDKEDIKNLTLTIILERDEDNNIINFPKDFKPQPPENGTDFTLAGLDAIRYIQRIQEEGKTTPEAPPP